MEGHSNHARSPLPCKECGTPLAHDQRYCVACGARRGPLPAHFSNLLGVILERGKRVRAAGTMPVERAGGDPSWYDAWLRTPRAAAVAVLGMLGFGVIVGSLVTGSAANPLAQLIVEVARSAGAGGLVGAGTGIGGSGATNTSITITTTSPAPQSATPSSSGAAATGTSTTTTTPNSNLPPIKHVFLVVLSNQGYNQTFAQSRTDPYLAKKLVKQGELLVNYYAVANSPLANEISMLSGQGPNPETASDCPTYDRFISSGFGAQGQQLGNGCVYPTTVPSLADQLTSDKLTWKAYLQTKRSQRKAKPEQCRPRFGTSPDLIPTPSRPYVAWRNPFLFFNSLTKPACPKQNVPLSRLASDLKSASTTPALSYIVADACDDGSDTPCAPHAKAGMGPADQFLKSVIPKIEHSPAYKDGGLIAVTFDEAPQTGPNADPSSCCSTPAYPNMLNSTTTTTGTTSTTGTTGTTTASTTTSTTTSASTSTTTSVQLTSTLTQVLTTTTASTSSMSSTGSATTTTSSAGTTTTSTSASLGSGETNPTGGGGHVGLLLISKFVKPNTLEVTDYFNHFSLLASIEQLFGLTRLGYAAIPSLPVFGSSVWTAFTPG